MLRQDVPFEIWWRIGMNLEVEDLISFSYSEPYFTSLFQDHLFTEFRELCPWYETDMTLGGFKRYLSDSKPLEIEEMTVSPANTPLPDDFTSLLGGMLTNNRSKYDFYLERKNLVAVTFNDRGIQVRDYEYGTKQVYLSESKLEWDSGREYRTHDPISVGEYTFEDFPENESCHVYMNRETLAITVVVLEDDEYTTQFYLSKVCDLKPVNNRAEMNRINIDKGCIKYFLAGSHFFSYPLENKHVIYVNLELQLEIPRILVGPRFNQYLYHSGIYKGKFYFLMNKEFFEVTCHKGRAGDFVSLGFIPWCDTLKQDDRYPQYLVCEVVRKPVGVVDLETFKVYKFPTEAQFQAIYMCGLSEGELKCYHFTHDFMRTRWESTAYKKEHLHTQLETTEYYEDYESDDDDEGEEEEDDDDDDDDDDSDGEDDSEDDNDEGQGDGEDEDDDN